MLLKAILLVSTLALAGADRTITFTNNCAFTIWPGGQGQGISAAATGFELAAGASTSVSVPDPFIAGRFWGRTGCNWNSGQFVCDTGDCGSSANNFGVQCQGIGGQPATLVEMTLQPSQDTYDMSNVDGYNIALSVAPVGGSQVNNPGLGQYNCGTISCTMNTAQCPPELQSTDSDGNIMCLSICAAVQDAAQRARFSILQQYYNDVNTRDLVCCSCDCGPNCGCDNAACKYGCSPVSTLSGGKCHVEDWPAPSTTQYASQYNLVFKNQCPNAYSWQFDDFSSTYQCVEADYQITFCPNGSSTPPTTTSIGSTTSIVQATAAPMTKASTLATPTGSYAPIARQRPAASHATRVRYTIAAITNWYRPGNRVKFEARRLK
ncbi:thaumatin [Endogone sp. FLAS-F59071]|nr:thaumatin [Endogone sp. FLAS-F59071]|eukprot:RUS19945.1 thaumatin [Endogone sp. FLAS-F59071]